MFTKPERERYNEDRERACKRLGITKNQYNWLRRKGEELRKVYEDNCNGIFNNEDDFNAICDEKERDIIRYTEGGEKYYVHFQTDPRGAVIYIDLKPIPANNYTQAVCIY